MTRARYLWPLAAKLGEGPLWHAGENALWFVDIKGERIHRLALSSGAQRSIDAPAQPAEPGYPDGIVVDSEGCLWAGLFAGWGLNRHAPSGKLLEYVPLPCANATKAAFGDADLRTLYITTAWKGLDAAARAAQPLAGGLFALRAGVPGLPQNEIRHGV